MTVAGHIKDHERAVSAADLIWPDGDAKR